MEAVFLAARALIVTYNSQDVIVSCLEALRRMAPGLAVTIFDNASSDTTVERARSAPSQPLVIANSSNVGFAGAVNRGFSSSAEPILLILNPDVSISTPLEPLISSCLQSGAAAGMLTDSKDQPQTGFSVRALPTPWALSFELLGLNRIWPSNPVNRHYRQLDRDLTAPGPVGQPAGAFLAIRRDVWETVGGFDESFYPVWFEDVDFCERLARAGFHISYIPSVRANHLGGHSVGQLPGSGRTRIWYASLLRYAAKHFSSLGYRGVCLAAVCSVVPRMFAGCYKERSLTPFTTYKEVLWLAGGRLFAARPV